MTEKSGIGQAGDIENEAEHATQLFFSILVRLRLSSILERLPVKLTPSQMTLLYALYQAVGQGTPVGRLAEELGVSAPAVTDIVDRLQRDGYVDRAADPEDRRVVRVLLTPAGKKAVERTVVAFEDLFRPLFNQMTPQQRSNLISGMEHLHELAWQMLSPSEPKEQAAGSPSVA